MQLEIVTPDKNLYQGEVLSVTFPGSDGSFGILNDHAPIVSTLREGEIKIIETNNSETSFSVKSGVVEVNNNKIIVLAE